MLNVELSFSKEEIRMRLEEFERIWPQDAQNDVALLSIALFIEEAFGLRLCDEDILYHTIGTPASAQRFILRKLQRS